MALHPPDEQFVGDYRLLKAFTKADNKAIKYIYNNFFSRVSECICIHGGSHDEARNVFQDALMALYKLAKRNKVVLTISFENYLFSICRYHWCAKFQNNKEVDLLIEEVGSRTTASTIIDFLEKAKQYRVLQNNISKFYSIHQQILKLHFQEYSSKEIAEKLGLSIRYINKKKLECLQRLVEYSKKDNSI